MEWSDQIVVKQVIATDFNLEWEFEASDLPHSCWGVFVYANTVPSFQREQLLYLI